MTDLFDSAGRKISLGDKIGTGGEGSVYGIPSLQHVIVAKVWHKPVLPEKQEKLWSMVKRCDESLKKIAAWPLATLHLGAAEGRIQGFLMPDVRQCEPIHHFYSPVDRKQRHPNKDWAFLVNTARNIAAAFAVIHNRGHVIGDVNPNVVFVAENSVVRLIDCDSFQITGENKLYPCEVGVSHFTPPELQQYSSFRGIRRTKNHDNFGLALLIFHLLMMGRHPFSGVFSGNLDVPLEKSIEQFRYAFGKNAASKGMAPPPNCVLPTILPVAITHLFERAFSEQGVQPDGRPTARDWIVALDILRKELRTCGQKPIHKYYSGLPTCPWCQQEQRSGNFFFVSPITAAASNFNLPQVWSQIMAIQSPGFAPQINLSNFQVKPMPLPPDLVGFFAFLKFSKRAWIRKKRQERLNLAMQNLIQIDQQWTVMASDSVFRSKMKELSELRTKHESLADQYMQEKLKIKENARNKQLNMFLARFIIKDHDIPGVCNGRNSILATFGIETAADISQADILNIDGFGQKLTAELVNWRKTLERKFVFDPSKSIDIAKLAALNQRFAQAYTQIETMLLAGPAQLKQIKAQILQQRSDLLPIVQEAARQAAQAQADLNALR